jgi:hypothetical protein
MLTGTCDVYHETAAFADHLAGTTVPCERCGEGRVHVAAATRITASVPAPAEKDQHPPDTAITDRPALAVSEPLEFHRPAPGTCPRCGSAAFKRLNAKKGTALKNDRECKGCGKPYRTFLAPLSDTARMAMYISGALVILGGVLPALAHLTGLRGPGGIEAPSFPWYFVMFSVLLGFQIFSMPWRTDQSREQRLKEYRASALPDTPPPVEVPRPPDMVFLSVMFGILALTTPLIASMLMAMLFGPPAVVCGLIALGQGHLKGLVGLVLGLLGLIVWGALFLSVISAFLR